MKDPSEKFKTWEKPKLKTWLKTCLDCRRFCRRDGAWAMEEVFDSDIKAMQNELQDRDK